jgi:hypothetical protein
VRDINQRARIDGREHPDIEAFIDVDYYVDDSDMFSVTGIKAMYTIIPSSVAGKGADSYWYIGADGTYCERICGGAVYRHRVWNYNTDIVVAEGTFSLTVYDVQVVPGPYNRAIVILVPSHTVWIPPFILRRYFKYPTLGRIGVASNARGDVALTVTRDRDVLVSIRRGVECGDCTTIPIGAYYAALDHVNKTKVPGVAGVSNVMERCDVKLSVPELYTLAAYLEAPADLLEPVNYTRSTNSDDPGKPFAMLAAVPLVPPASAPTIHDVNIEASVQERVIDVANNVIPPQKYRDYAREYNARLLPPNGRKLVPLTREEAILALAKTSQKFADYLRNESCIKSDKLEDIDAFLKAEVTPNASAKGKPSRLIFPVEKETLILTTRFIAPYKAYELERARNGTGFSCVGLSPAEIADRVHKFALQVNGPIDQTDFTSMDGTHSDFTNQNYLYLYRNLYSAEHRKDIVNAFQRNYDRTVKMPRTVEGGKRKKFKSRAMNLSGKADTTNSNTWPNGFVDYCALRNGGLDPDQAFSRVGPKFGDDGLGDGNYDRVTVARELGFIMKSEIAPEGEAVSFLSRVFVRPRATGTSIVEPLRALAKIPVSVRSVAGSNREDLANRVHGYTTSDPSTPLVSDYCRALVRIYRLRANLKTLDRDMAHRIDGGPYPYDKQFEGDAINVIASRLSLSAGEVMTAIKQLSAAKSEKDLLKIRLVQASRLAPGLLPVGEPSSGNH